MALSQELVVRNCIGIPTGGETKFNETYNEYISYAMVGHVKKKNFLFKS